MVGSTSSTSMATFQGPRWPEGAGRKVLLRRSPGSEEGGFAYPAREYVPFGEASLRRLGRGYEKGEVKEGYLDPFHLSPAKEAEGIFRHVIDVCSHR